MYPPEGWENTPNGLSGKAKSPARLKLEILRTSAGAYIASCMQINAPFPAHAPDIAARMDCVSLTLVSLLGEPALKIEPVNITGGFSSHVRSAKYASSDSA